MAKNKSETEATEAVDLASKVKPLHKAHAAFLKNKFGVDVPPEHIFAVYSTRVEFRKTSDVYQDAKAEAAKAKEEAAARKEQAKAEKAEKAAKAKAEKEAAEKAEKEKAEKASAKTAKPAAAKPAAKGAKKPF